MTPLKTRNPQKIRKKSDLTWLFYKMRKYRNKQRKKQKERVNNDLTTLKVHIKLIRNLRNSLQCKLNGYQKQDKMSVKILLINTNLPAQGNTKLLFFIML